MTRIVRFEELNGELILRVPEDVARKLGFSLAEPVKIVADERGLTLERMSERARRQFELGMRIIEEDDAVLAALAR